jgi:hypothetical protein
MGQVFFFKKNKKVAKTQVSKYFGKEHLQQCFFRKKYLPNYLLFPTIIDK